MVNKKAKTLDNDLADALGEEKADTLHKTLCYIGAKTLVGALAYTLKKMEVKKISQPWPIRWPTH